MQFPQRREVSRLENQVLDQSMALAPERTVWLVSFLNNCRKMRLGEVKELS